MLEELIVFKEYLEKLKKKKSATNEEYSAISKLLVIANITEMVIYSNTKVPIEFRAYFDRQAAVGRYFGDWGEEYVAKEYFKICQYVKEHHW